MAAQKSKQNPHKWPNGTWHSRPYYGGDGKKDAPKPKPATPKPAPPPAPTAPAAVGGFFLGDDMAAINDFTTRYATELANIDFELGQLATDTEYQKGQTNTQAKQNSSDAADVMVGRGVFKSSIKDAALYDIEAQRALATKFLDDKLTSATLNAGTMKQIMADGKRRFDEAMLQRQGENAAAVNDEAAKVWADQMATWQKKYGKPAAPAPATGGATAPKPATPKPAAPRAPVQNTSSIGNDQVYAREFGPSAGNSRKRNGKTEYRWPNGTWHSRPYRGN